MNIRHINRSRHCNDSRPAFTLVELLVVIGIIAILIGIILPALRRAREAAQAVQCMSNIRQLSIATISFATDHKGYMPAQGGNGVFIWDTVNGVIAPASGSNIDDTDIVKVSVADWIAWARHKDPVTGQPNSAPNQNITYSALARYMGVKLKLTPVGDYNASNNADPALDAVFRCPSDRLEGRPSAGDASHGFYRYSYAMNKFYANPVKGAGGYPAGARVDGTFNGKINSIHKPDEKVLFICEDEKTLSSGSFTPQAALWSDPQSTMDLVSSRHESRAKRATNGYSNKGTLKAEGHEECLGNVGFCDGHAEFFSRKDSLRARYCGSPVPDPQGF
jgi:prepilin-type N-terminal cleavage/methylation domain-containing protein/prepilin-type processing-associated H-X9-DG protein